MIVTGEQKCEGFIKLFLIGMYICSTQIVRGSVIRNALISKMLYLNKSIEQFGSGFKRINSLCKDSAIRIAEWFAEDRKSCI